MKKKFQISESVELGILLALAGGFMDAYSYICRGEVFANAQTGNMVLFGINLASGNFEDSLRYFLPVLSFAIGIAISDFVRQRTNEKSLFHWRQISIIAETAALFAVGFMPLSLNLPANCITSLACGIQVESFRKIHGNSVATTMCIGNLRSATEHINDYKFTKNKSTLRKGIFYYLIILVFISGAVIGNFCVKLIEEKAIFICCIFLLIAFIMMFADREKGNNC